MKKYRVSSFFLVLLVISLLVGCGSSGTVNSSSNTDSAKQEENLSATPNPTDTPEASPSNDSGNVIDNRKNNAGNNNSSDSQQDASVTDKDFDVTGYLWENSIGDSLYFLAVKNNSGVSVKISANGIAKDAGGNMIGAADSSIDVLGPGEESICYFYFDSVSGIDTVEYSLDYSTATWYYPIVSNLDVKQTLNDKNVTLSVTNNGNTCAQFVEAYALFFDANNKVISYDSTYVTDSDSEIKPGKTINSQLDSYGAYDHVAVYFTGRSDGSTVDLSQYASSDDFLIDEYLYSNSIGDSLYFLVITNNSNQSVGISANGTAKDANGNTIGADDLEIDVLGPGEQSIGYFYFDGVRNLASVDYSIDYSTNISYTPVLANLDVQQTINNKNVIVSVTNNGSTSAEFVEAYALFFDASGKVVGYESAYVTDDDSEIKSGKTITKQLDAYNAFDTVKVFLTGRHSNW